MVLTIKAAVLLLCAACACASAQEAAAGPTLTAGARGGWSFKYYPEAEFSYDRIGGLSFEVCTNWRMKDFFGVALAFGSTRISSSYDPVVHEQRMSPARASLHSYWLRAGLHLRFESLSVDPGVALHVVRSSIDAFGQQSAAERMDPAYVLACAWHVPLGASMSLTAGFAAHYLTALRVCLLLPQVGIERTLLE